MVADVLVFLLLSARAHRWFGTDGAIERVRTALLATTAHRAGRFWRRHQKQFHALGVPT